MIKNIKNLILLVIVTLLIPQSTNAWRLPKKYDFVGTWEITKIQRIKGLRKEEKAIAEKLMKKHLGAVITFNENNTITYKIPNSDSTIKGNWNIMNDFYYYYDATAHKERRIPAIRLVISLETDNDWLNGVIRHISIKKDKFKYYNEECNYHLLKLEQD